MMLIDIMHMMMMIIIMIIMMIDQGLNFRMS